MKIYLVIAVAAASIMAVGCGNKSPGQAAQAVKSQVTSQTNEERNVLGIAGDWTAPCVPYDLIGDLKYMKEQYHLGTDHSLTKKLFTYSDSNCKSQGFVRVEDGTYKTVGSSTPKEGVAINFNFTTVTIEPTTPFGVTALNKLNFCGASNYQLNQPTNVTAHSGDPLCVKVVKTPRIAYDFLKLTDDTHMALGKDGEVTAEKDRPTEVDTSTDKLFTKN